MKNVKTVKIIIPNDRVLKLVTSTPIYQRLTRLKLKIGENVENVNHSQYEAQMRMFPIAGAQIEDITK